ncbi:retroviral-like aspartic protease family protein [Thalassotalea maritima]|uniref:retroviral-like aspartic protease family protein n=1 Tax=Thalassotalea maritima TaxID=3242416 RepID=UPI003526EFF8
MLNTKVNNKLLLTTLTLLVLSLLLNLHLLSQLSQQQKQAALLSPSLSQDQRLANPFKTQRSDLPETPQHQEQTIADTRTEGVNSELLLIQAKAKQFFASYQFDNALDMYAELHSADAILAEQLKQLWVKESEAWLEQEQLSLANSFLDLFIGRYPFDFDMTRLFGKLLHKRGQTEQVFNLYADIIRNEYDVSRQQILTAELNHYYHAWATSQKQRQKYQHLIDVSKTLIEQQGNVPSFVLSVAEAHIQLNQIDTGYQYLLSISHLDTVQDEVNNLLALISRKRRSLEGIALARHGEHMVVQATMQSSRQQLDTALMIDTGASMTVISEQIFAELSRYHDIARHREVNIHTASGTEQAFTILLDGIMLNEWRIDNFEVVVMPLTSMEGADGLLGMNFFKHFEFQINQADMLLMLNPK